MGVSLIQAPEGLGSGVPDTWGSIYQDFKRISGNCGQKHYPNANQMAHLGRVHKGLCFCNVLFLKNKNDVRQIRQNVKI